MIKCLFFAQLADAAERSSLVVEFQEGTTPALLVDALAGNMPRPLIDSLRLDGVMVSVNQVLAAWDDGLSDGDEVAFLPPFSGG